MATGGGRIERAVTSGRSEKGPKEPDFWRAVDVGNKGLDRESQNRPEPPFRQVRGQFLRDSKPGIPIGKGEGVSRLCSLSPTTRA